MRMDPSNKDIKILLDAVITRIDKNEKENSRISKALIIIKEEIKDINKELDGLLVEIIGESPHMDDIEKKHLNILTQINSLNKTEEKAKAIEDELDIEYLDTIVGES